VVNDNPVSLHTAKTIDMITKDLKNAIKWKYVVTNMVRNGMEQELKKRIEDSGLNYFGDIPYDQHIVDAVYAGKSLDTIGDTPAKKSIRRIIEIIGG
jgi:CO dehydrogenase nickel-insertion accessory protein CooC1